MPSGSGGGPAAPTAVTAGAAHRSTAPARTAGAGRIDTAEQWRAVPTFHADGTVPVALALAGLAAGAPAGLLLRRSLAAPTAAVLALAGLRAAVHAALPHLWPTATEVTSPRDGPLPGGIVTGDGIVAGTGVLTVDGDRLAAPCGSETLPGCGARPADLDAVGFHHDLHPAGHSWPLQLMASGVPLVVAVLPALAAFRVLRPRTADPAGRGARHEHHRTRAAAPRGAVPPRPLTGAFAVPAGRARTSPPGAPARPSPREGRPPAPPGPPPASQDVMSP